MAMTIALIAFFATLLALTEWLVRDRIALVVARLYLGWWALCLVVSSLDPMDLFPVSGFAYALLLLNVGMFMLGFVGVGHGVEPRTGPAIGRGLERDFRDRVERNRVLLAVLVGLFPILLRYYLRYQDALAEVGLVEARNLRYYVGPVFGTTLEVLAYNYFAESVALALACIVAYALVLGSVASWVFVWSAADLVLFTGIGGGRTIIVQGGLFLVLLALLRGSFQGTRSDGSAGEIPGEGEGRRKSLLLFVGLPGILMLAFMVYQTFARMVSLETGVQVLLDGELVSVAAQTFLDHVWNYSIGPFRALDHALRNPSLFEFHHGRLTFAAIDEMIGYPLRLLGFNYPILNHEIGAITQEAIFIGSDEFNALYTAVFRYYFDFGVPGVAVFAAAFGAGVRWCVLWFEDEPTVASLAVVLFLFGAAMLSTQLWHLSSPAAVFFLAGAYAVHRRSRRGLTEGSGHEPAAQAAAPGVGEAAR